MKLGKDDFWPGGFLLAAWTALNERILFQGHTYVLADASSIFYHLWKWGGGVFRSGQIPLWCPDAAFGTPYLADPTNAALYPVKFLLYQLLEPTTAFTVLLAGHSLWGLAGFWIWARQGGASPWSTLVGSLIFGFSFNTIMLFWCTSMPLSMAWTPWVFWAVEKCWKREKNGWLFLSAALAFQWAAGYPLFGFMTVFLLLGDWAFRHWAGKDRLPRGSTLKGAGVLAWAALFNAAWMLSLAEFIPYSNLSRRAEMASSIQWGDWGTWLNPFYRGHPLFTPSTGFIFQDYFAGLPSLVLILYGLGKGYLSRRTLFLGGGVLVLSLGETAFVGGWLKEILPGYHWVVRSGYWLPFVVLLMAMASLGVVDGLRRETPRGWDLFGWMLSLGIYAAALLAGVPWELWSFWISLVSLLLFFNRDWKSPLRAVFLFSALVFSLGPVDRGVFFTMPRSFYDDAPPLPGDFTQPGRLYQPPDWVEGFLTVSGKGVAEAYHKIKKNMVPDWPLSFDRPEAGYTNTLFLEPFLDWYYRPERVPAEASRKILSYLGARYVMGLPAPPKVPRLEEGCWENTGAMPLWFSVERAQAWDFSGDPDGPFENPRFDFKKTALVRNLELEGPYSPRKVMEISRGPNDIHLEAEGPGRAFLVSSEMAYPGWWGRVNGTWRPLETVNGCFRGLRIEPGETSAEIVYRPETFRLGLFLSFLACGIGAGLILKNGLSKGF